METVNKDERKPTLQLEDYMCRKVDFSKIKHNLCASDVESLTLNEVLALADDECRDLWNQMVLGYTESEGEPLLREEAARLHGVEKEDVIITCPQEGIFCAMNVLTKMTKRQLGKESFSAVSTFPAYQALYENLRQLGVDISYWRVRFDGDRGWHFSLDDLKVLLKEDTKVLVINFPHNPTGAVLSPEERTELVQICRERGIFIFSDEIYSFTENDGSSPPPSMCSMYENSISLFGMSKSLALPGLRIGWLCTRNAEVNRALRYYKDFTSMCPPRPSEVLALIAVRNLPVILARTMDIVGENVRLWTAFFSRHQEAFAWVAPPAGIVCLVRLKGWLLRRGGALAFCQRALDHGGVMLLHGPMFGYDDEHARVGFAKRGLKEGLEALEKFLADEKSKADSLE